MTVNTLHGYTLTKRLVFDGRRPHFGVSPDGVAVFIRLAAAAVSDRGKAGTLQFLNRYRALDCGSVIRVRDFWIEPGRLVLVTDLADGGSLKDRLSRQKSFTAEELIPHFRMLGEATDCLHRQGILHGEIGPTNLLLHHEVVHLDVPCLRTFALGGSAPIVFRPSYTAPEVLQQTESPQSDQYSLAASYVELRLGRPIFSEVAGNALSKIKVCLTREPDLELLPHGERAVLRKGLAKDSAQRYPTCLAFVEELQRAVDRPTA
jgi:serine/threonine protein kinase